MYFSFRHKWKTNKEATKELMSTYPEHIVGMVLYEILKHHFEKNIHYQLSSEAEDLFEEIIDNFNAQFIFIDFRCVESLRIKTIL